MAITINCKSDGICFLRGFSFNPKLPFLRKSRKSDWYWTSYRWLPAVCRTLNIPLTVMQGLDHYNALWDRCKRLREAVARQVILNTPIFEECFRIDLWPSQKHAASVMAAARRYYLGDDVGLGKQMPIDTGVMTPKGWKSIGTLQVGDYVIGSDGKPTRVIGVYSQGVKPSYRITFSDRSSVEAGDQHLWAVRYWCGGKYLKDLVLTTEQLRERPIIDSPSGKSLDLCKTRLFIPTLSAPVEFEKKALPIGPYTVGALIANGGLTHGGSTISCHSSDGAHVEERIRKEGVEVSDGKVYGNVYRIYCRGVRVVLRNLGLDVGSKEKRIPTCYLRGSPDERIALLHGLMDGDGSVSLVGNRVTYCTCSELLAEDVQELVEGVGGIASIREYDRSKEDKPIEYHVRIRLPISVDPFSVPRKAARYNPGFHAHPTRRVVSVDYVRDVEQVCIAVDASDRLYLTEHCILTHNTFSAFAAFVLLKEKQLADSLLVICTASVKYQWFNEIHNALQPDTRRKYQAVVIGGPKEERVRLYKRAVPIRIVNYESFRADCSNGVVEDSLAKSPPSAVILDECWKVRNKSTKTWRAISGLLKGTRYVYGLNAAPIGNGYEDLYGVVQLLDPTVFLNWTAFEGRYINRHAVHHWVKSYKNVEDLKHRVSDILLRRTVHDLNWDFPTVVSAIYWVNLTKNQRKDYEELKCKRSGDIAVHNMARTVCLYSSTIPPHLSPKYKELLRICKEVVPSEKLIVFSESKRFLQGIVSYLRKAGLSCSLISGDMDGSKRDEAQRSFTEGNVRVLLLTSAGEAGLNLQAASVVVNLDLPWNPERLRQRVGRVRLFLGGKERRIRVLNIIAKDTVEERVIQKIIDKIGYFHRIFDQEKKVDLIGEFSSKELDQLL